MTGVTKIVVCVILMMHIKEPLLVIGKSSPCGSSGFPLSVSETKQIMSVETSSKRFLFGFFWIYNAVSLVFLQYLIS